MNSNLSRRYPQQLRESIARRYLTTEASYRSLAAEIGSSSWVVRDWVRQYREFGQVGRRKKPKATTTGDRSASDKLHILMAAKELAEAERGEFLRSEGVRDADLELWEREALAGLGGAVSSETHERRIRELESERRKQDKRLREATALLELQKKVQALWADEDDDTPQS